MTDPWHESMNPPGGRPVHPPTERVGAYSQSRHIEQLSPRFPSPPDTRQRAQPAFTPGPTPAAAPYRPQASWAQQQPAPRVPAPRPAALTVAEGFWYVVMCIGFGAGYFAKVPVKKALSELGMARMTAAEQFWYVLMCISFGAGYFAKVPVKKALSEMRQS